MGLSDVAWIVPIVGGAVFLLYRSVWKKRGYCHGCGPSEICESKKPGRRPPIGGTPGKGLPSDR